MSIPTLLSVLFIGLVGWGGWPLIANFSAIKDPFVRGFLVNAAVVVAFLPFVIGKMNSGMLVSGSVWILIIAGLVNFIGHILFSKIQVMPGSQISVYQTMIPALAVLTSAVGGPIFFGDSVTFPKIVCTVLIVAGIAGLAFTSFK